MRTYLLIVFALLTSIRLTSAGEENKLPFKITTKRDDDRSSQKVARGTAFITLHSPTGISQAVIERNGEKWPDVVIRLHLKGLENFRVSTGAMRLELVAGLKDGKPQVRQWKDGKEDMPLDPKSPHWIDVRILGDDGKPASEIPLKGYFELRMPRSLFDGNPKSITLNWIDFYR